MNRQMIKYTLAVSALLALLAGCGGGGGGGSAPAPTPTPTPAPPPTGGIDRAGVAVGVITGFGSVFVNGVEYETGSASITIDDNPGLESDLGVGDVVTIVGTVDDSGTTGTATTLNFDDNVEGPIQSIDVAGNTLVVLGQTVIVTATTVFDNSSISPPTLAGLAVGDVVEVSGFPNASGEIEATRIEGKAAGGELEVRGTVTALDTAAMRFALNSLIVDYASAVLDDFPGGVISDGNPVEVKGVSFDAAGNLIATRVEFENDPFAVNDGDNAEIEGFITRFVSASDFSVAGRPVTTNAQTVFFNGAAADLALNVKVEAEGAFDAAGVLNATKVVFKLQTSVRIAAAVEAIDTATGAIELLGIRIVTDAVTQFEDDSSTQQARFGLANLSVGDYVQVRGFEDTSAMAVRAVRLERDDAEDEVELRGFVEAVNQPNLTILGVTIQTNASTQFEDLADNALTASQFFGAVQPGSLVEAKGNYLGGSIVAAEEVEFEDD